MAHANAPVPLPSRPSTVSPPALDIVVQRAMEKDRDKRARSAGALMRWAADQLQAGVAPAPVSDESPTEDTVLMPQASQATAHEVAAGRQRSLLSATLLHVAIYAPLWIVTYLVGRSI